MSKSAIKFATLALFSMALIASPPSVPAFAAGGGGDPPSANPPPPDTRPAPKSSSKSRKKPTKQSSADDAAFGKDTAPRMRRSMSATIMLPPSGSSRRSATTTTPSVANLIGYSYRKLGDYRLSQTWYERALKDGPEPRADLAVLRPVADRAGQSRPGVVSSSRIAAICGRAARSTVRWPPRSKSRRAPGSFIERYDVKQRARFGALAWTESLSLRPRRVRRGGRHGAGAEIVQHEQPNRRGQIALLAVAVDLADQFGQASCRAGPRFPSCRSRTPLRG